MLVWLVIGACGLAVERMSDPNERATIYVGAGAVISSQPYDGTDFRTYPIPIFGYEGKRLYLRGITGGYRLFMGKSWSVGPVVQPRFDGYEEDDSSALAGMDDRNVSLDAGVGLSWRTDYGLLEASVVTDLLGEHDGQQIELSWTGLFSWKRWDFIPSAGVRFKSTNLVEYYYGVEPGEALATRPAYAPDRAVDPFVRLAVRRELTERWSLLTALQYEWLDSEIRDSPIVDDNYDLSIMGGVMYSF